MTQPINLIYRYLISEKRITVYFKTNTFIQIRGKLIGFDEYMNLVMDNTELKDLKWNRTYTIGLCMIKGHEIVEIKNVVE